MSAVKKKKKELEIAVQKVVDSADKKAKEAEEQKVVLLINFLLIESNVSRKRSQDIMENDIYKEDNDIQKVMENY